MGRGRPGGNPNISKAGRATRLFPPLVEGEKSKDVGVALPESVYQELGKVAEQMGTSRAGVTRQALMEFLERLKAEQAVEQD